MQWQKNILCLADNCILSTPNCNIVWVTTSLWISEIFKSFKYFISQGLHSSFTYLTKLVIKSHVALTELILDKIWDAVNIHFGKCQKLKCSILRFLRPSFLHDCGCYLLTVYCQCLKQDQQRPVCWSVTVITACCLPPFIPPSSHFSMLPSPPSTVSTLRPPKPVRAGTKTRQSYKYSNWTNWVQ